MLNKRAKALYSLLFRFMLSLVLNFNLSQGDEVQFELLLSFKSSINDRSGFLSNWNSSSSFCLWHGITCNNYSRVKAIELVDKNITGTISSSIFHFPEIETINLSHNQLTINLSHNQLSGEIPFDLVSSTSLRYLNLCKNNLTGPIAHCSISLEILFLCNNQLSGEISPEIGVCSNLKELDLGGNNLEGKIPSSISNISSLQIFTLAANKLVGQIPCELSQMTSLKWIYFGYNNLSGEIPQELGDLVSLKHLDLVYNNLSGQIPSSLGNLSNLQYLYLYQNNLTGLLPRSIFGLKKLIELDLSDNYLSGEIPELIMELQSLEVLHLFGNDVAGKIPNALASLPRLQFLSLSFNSLTGEIPSLICNVSSIEVLALDHNNLSGSIPQCLGNFSKNLSVLDLAMNKFHGTIIETFGENCGLMNLNLHSNKLEGTIPRSLINCKKLEMLDIGHNKIDDTLPSWLETLPELQVLVLRSNKLHGILQSSNTIHPFPKLRIFDLANNEFTGPLPKGIIENMKALMNLKSPFKYMQGRYYVYDVQLTVKSFDIEFNQISTIVTSIDLSNNNFDGEIPCVIGKLSSLRGLNLSYNSLSGKIPKELTDLTFLAFLNLSHNQLTGPIPYGKQFSTFENGSYQGNLALCGFPMSKACNNDGIKQSSPLFLKEADESETKISFGWKVVLLGYGCGLIVGVVVTLRKREPKWFIALFGNKYHRKPRRRLRN
ncbi:hypothetical protein REPUB_Repub05bG0015900 [Reevesia pubescens]